MDLNRQVSPILWHGRIERHLNWQNGKQHNGRLQIQGDSVENLELIDLELEHVEWKGIKIRKLELIRCSFDQFNFSLSTALKSRFDKCHLSNCNLQACDISGAKLIQSKFDHCDLSQSNFSYGVMEESIWTECTLDSSNVHGSDLRDIKLKKCKGFSPNFSDSYAAGAEFADCNFNQSDWSHFIGWDTRWIKVQLNKSNFFGSDLRHSIFKGCHIQDANFEYCQIDENWLDKHKALSNLWIQKTYTEKDTLPLALNRNLQERYRAIARSEGKVYYLRRVTR